MGSSMNQSAWKGTFPPRQGRRQTPRMALDILQNVSRRSVVAPGPRQK